MDDFFKNPEAKKQFKQRIEQSHSIYDGKPTVIKSADVKRLMDQQPNYGVADRIVIEDIPSMSRGTFISRINTMLRKRGVVYVSPKASGIEEFLNRYGFQLLDETNREGFKAFQKS